MKVNKMNLTALRNEEHFQFMSDVKQLVEAYNPTTMGVDQLFPTFTTLFNREDITMEVIRKSALTDPITDVDAQRDALYRGLIMLIETFSHSANPEKTTAAHNIQVVIDNYGDFRFKPYNEETATLYHFLQDINERCANDVQVLNAQDWITDLDNTNKAFDKLMNHRFDENLGREIINMRETRKEIDKVYAQMVDRVNAFILLQGEKNYADFVYKMNERIAYFRNTINLRKGRTAGKKDEAKV